MECPTYVFLLSYSFIIMITSRRNPGLLLHTTRQRITDLLQNGRAAVGYFSRDGQPPSPQVRSILTCLYISWLRNCSLGAVRLENNDIHVPLPTVGSSGNANFFFFLGEHHIEGGIIYSYR